MSRETQWFRIGGATDAGHEAGPGICKLIIRNRKTAGLQQFTQVLRAGPLVAWGVNCVETYQRAR